MKNTLSPIEEALCPCIKIVDQPFLPGGQFIEMDFMASNSYKSTCARLRPRQKSLDSQEFGFASNLVNSTEVAPADELFFRGQLLPLQSDHRLNLVQALSECGQDSKGGNSRRPSNYVSEDEDKEVVELINGRMEDHGELDSMIRNSDNLHPQQGLRGGDHRILSWYKDEEFHSCRIEGADNRTSTHSLRVDHHPHFEQGGPIGRDEEEGPRLSPWCRDHEEISFHSCRMEGEYFGPSCKGNMNIDAIMDLSSSSFRSQNSGFWESGADKDTGGDSSSSSRDSNGSSQDSYFPNNNHTTKPPSTPCPSHHHPHYSKINFIPWKSLFRRASKKQPPPASSSISREGYSEDLSKYKDCPTPTSLTEVKEALLPLKLDNESHKGDSRISSINGGSQHCGHAEIKPIIHHNTTKDEEGTGGATTRESTCSDGTRKGKKGAIVQDAEKEEMKKKKEYSRSAGVKGERSWQGYARRLKPLYEMKRGIMGQFRMDECGRKACEVESGTIYAASRSSVCSVQRRLCHQTSSLFNTHKISIQQKNPAKLYYPNSNNNSNINNIMLAMSSCPSSPTHSGVLASIPDTSHKGTALPAPNCANNSGINTSININKFNTNRTNNKNPDSRCSINISNSNTTNYRGPNSSSGINISDSNPSNIIIDANNNRNPNSISGIDISNNHTNIDVNNNSSNTSNIDGNNNTRTNISNIEGNDTRTNTSNTDIISGITISNSNSNNIMIDCSNNRSNTRNHNRISGINRTTTKNNKTCNYANTNNVLPNSSTSCNYSSISTMHELHSALQSAIAHCKESNKNLNFPA